jgi:hypothetical protein
MANMAGLTQGNQRIVSLSSKRIPEVDVIKTLEDTILGVVLLGKFVYEGENEVNYTYIKRLEIGLDQSQFWTLVSNSKKHPEKGFIPKILAYSVHSEQLKGYLDCHSDQHELRKEMLGSDGDDFVQNFSPGKIRELYFEPFPENLRISLQKRSKDKLPYTEPELFSFTISLLQTLQSLEQHGMRHGNLSADCVVLVNDRHCVYHPCLVPASVNAYARVHALAKHYTAPEVVDLILECASPQEFALVVDDIDWHKADVFSVGLLALEMASLVEEDDWYNEDMMLRKDLLELKMNLVRSQYSLKLARLLEAMLAPYQARPSVEALLKLAKPKSEGASHFEKLLQNKNKDRDNEQKIIESPLVHKEIVPSNFESDREISSSNDRPEKEVSDVDSREAKKLVLKSHTKVDQDTHSDKFPEIKNEIKPKTESSPMTFPQRNEIPQKINVDRFARPEEVKPFDSMLYSSNIGKTHETSPKEQGPLRHEAISDYQINRRIDPINVQPVPQKIEQGQGTYYPYQISQNIYGGIQRPAVINSDPNRQIKLPEMQTISGGFGPIISTQIHPSNTNMYPREPSPVNATRVIYRRLDPVEVSPKTLGVDKHIEYNEREARPTGKSTVREDRSKSPKVVSIKKYIMRDGQKVLISEEHFPGYDDGFRGYINLRGQTPEKIRDSSPQADQQQSPPKPQLQYLPAPVQQYPQLASTKMSLEPVFGTDSMYKPQPLSFTQNIGTTPTIMKPAVPEQNKPASANMTASKVHSLAALQKAAHQDFASVLGDIKAKVDELVERERNRDQVEAKSRSRSKPKKREFLELENTPFTRDDKSGLTFSHVNLDLSNVECCEQCRKLRKDKQSHLYQCLNRQKVDRHVRPQSKSARSITPSRQPKSVERKLEFAKEKIDPHMPSPIQSKPKRLVPLIGLDSGTATPDHVKKFKEATVDSKSFRHKTGQIAAELLNFDMNMNKKDKGKSTSKPQINKPKKIEKDVWLHRLQMNGKKLEGS